VGAVMHEEHNSTSSRERLTQSTPNDQINASDDTEHREWLLSQHGPVLSRSPGTGRLEAGVSTNDQRRWKAHHQDLYASKWFKALIWLIFAAISQQHASYSLFLLLVSTFSSMVEFTFGLSA